MCLCRIKSHAADPTKAGLLLKAPLPNAGRLLEKPGAIVHRFSQIGFPKAEPDFHCCRKGYSLTNRPAADKTLFAKSVERNGNRHLYTQPALAHLRIKFFMPPKNLLVTGS